MNSPLFLETIKVKDGIFYNVELHQKRLQKTTNHFYGTSPKLELSSSLLPDHLQKGLIKCRVLYNSEIVSIEFEKYNFKEIKSLAIIEANDIEYRYKSVDRHLLNELYKRRAGASDIIIVKDGFVTDSSYANLVFENDMGLFTPRKCLLEGTKRRYLLDKGVVKEMDIKLSDLSSFSTVYLVNAMIDLEDKIGISVFKS